MPSRGSESFEVRYGNIFCNSLEYKTDAMVTVLDGVGEFTVGGVKHVCKAGEALVMPATIPHAVYAVERFKMLLTVVFPIEK